MRSVCKVRLADDLGGTIAFRVTERNFLPVRRFNGTGGIPCAGKMRRLLAGKASLKGLIVGRVECESPL